jgi:SAM-dependent methyltransferase
MIELARTEEAKTPLGVVYKLGDVREVNVGNSFDVVLGSYLLNYAETADELLKMCQAAARHLKPGGRFVGVNNNPEEPPEHFASSRKYGFVKRREGESREGAPIIYTIFLESGPFELTNYQLSTATLERAFRAAGFESVHWHGPKVSPEGIAEFGAEFWADFVESPPVIFFEARKGPKTTS